MAMKEILDRRKLFALSGTAGLTGLVGTSVLARDLCRPTAPQVEGPFYPVVDQDDTDWDLTRLRGSERLARGEAVFVTGRILDLNCRAVSGALVEIWQACDTGKYDHPRDPNPAAIDPDFQYWGRVLSGSDGSYRFKTIIPGAYPATPDWIRPPHIHFKVTAPGIRPFVTQMYFAGDPLNDSDRILNSLTPAQRRGVIVDFSAKKLGGKYPVGEFDLVLNVSGRADLTPELD